MPTPHVVLYTRAGCCLCDDALAHLRAAGVTPQIVDIDANPALREKFTTCVPVVEIEGKVRFRGRVNPVLLKRVLHAPAGMAPSQDAE
jgi:glutaredoxin